MAGDKVLDPDGFPPLFFHNFWAILRDDPLAMVEESREKIYMSKEINNTFIVLVGKRKRRFILLMI